MTKIKSLLGIGVLFSALLVMSNPSEAGLQLQVVNNVESADFQSICMQGYSVGPPETYLIQVGAGASFSTTMPAEMPIFNVTSTSTNPLPIATYTTNLNILGGRLYFWLSKTGCAANEALLTIDSTTGALSLPLDKYDQTSLPFQIIELSDVSGTVNIDLSNVDSFNLPVQLAVNQSSTAAYPVGISNVATNSDKTLKAIMNVYNTFMVNAYKPVGQTISPYLSLVTTNVTFPDGMGPILNPGSFLELIIPVPTTIFKPNAASPLVHEFNASINELFGKTIHITEDGKKYYIGEPIQNIVIANAPSGLSGYGFCLNNVVTPLASCKGNYKYYMLNPTRLVVSHYPDHSLLMGLVPGSGGGTGTTSTTINFTEPLPAGTLTEGMFIQAPAGNWAAPYNSAPYYPDPQIVHCLSGLSASSVIPCSSSQIMGVTVNIGTNPGTGSNTLDAGPYQFMFSMIPWSSVGNIGNFGNSFMTAGEQVFNGSGVFGGEGKNASGVRVGGAPAAWVNPQGVSIQLTTSAAIGNLISTALNRGVTGTVCSTSNCSADIDSTVWNTQENWYPSNTALNQYASFWHNATINNVNIGELPFSPTHSNGYPAIDMATAYGFAYDEDPMGGLPNPGPNVPAEMIFNAVPPNGNLLTFTFGPLYGAQQGGNPGICGSANNVPSEQVPSVGLCSSGKQSTVTGGGSSPWSWTCNGTNGSTVNASCSAPVQSPPPPPLLGCGTDQGGSFANEPPASGLCLPSNIASLVSIDKAHWIWSCTVSTVGTKSCNAKHLGKKQKPINFIGSLNLHANRGEFIKFTGGSGQGKVSYSVASSGKVYCSVQTINGAKWLRTQGGAGVCKLTITKAGDSTYQPTSVTKSIAVR
jgi:hypothetical protein